MDLLFSCCPYLIIFLILTGTVGITPIRNLVNDDLVTDLNTKKAIYWYACSRFVNSMKTLFLEKVLSKLDMGISKHWQIPVHGMTFKCLGMEYVLIILKTFIKYIEYHSARMNITC